MELTQLQQFKTVAETGNISRAAEKLYISQSALSQSVRRLEEELGVPLFDHRKNRIELNAAGEIMLAHTRRIFAEVEAMYETAAGLAPMVNELKICSMAKGYCRYAFFTLGRHYPDVAVETKIQDEESCINSLRSGECDLIFLSEPLEAAKYSCRFLGVMQGAVSVSNRDALAARTAIGVEDLRGREIYMHQSFGPMTRRMIDLMDRMGMSDRKRMIADDMLYASYFQNQTRDIVFTTNLMDGYLHSFDRRIVPLIDEELKMEIWVIYAKEKELLLSPFVKLLEKQF